MKRVRLPCVLIVPRFRSWRAGRVDPVTRQQEALQCRLRLRPLGLARRERECCTRLADDGGAEETGVTDIWQRVQQLVVRQTDQRLVRFGDDLRRATRNEREVRELLT